MAKNYIVGFHFQFAIFGQLAIFEFGQKWPKKMAKNLENGTFWPKFGQNSAHPAPFRPKVDGPWLGPLNWQS